MKYDEWFGWFSLPQVGVVTTGRIVPLGLWFMHIHGEISDSDVSWPLQVSYSDLCFFDTSSFEPDSLKNKLIVGMKVF